ncbi:MAG: 3'-5' exonuclease [Rhabdochlamydiaceae bacterium]|nr:3'-5' exonuclease [Rhabdochlamydiaceae bacterium]
MLGIFLDTETNGLNPFVHRVLEIAFKIVDLTSGKVVDSYVATLKQPPEEWSKSDPVSLKVNGFTLAMVEQGISPSQAATEITNILQKNKVRRETAVFICQNPSFDRIFFSQLISPDIQEGFKWPYYWLDFASMYWAEAMRAGRNIDEKFPWKTGFSKDKIAHVYALPSEASPHRAMNGVDHLLLCYERVIGFQ